MKHLEETFSVSERRACQAIDQPRSTQRYPARENGDEERLVGKMVELSTRHPRYGYRRITSLLREEGWHVNRKRVHRLWRQEGLKISLKQRKRRAVGWKEGSRWRLRAEHPDHVWSYDGDAWSAWAPQVGQRLGLHRRRAEGITEFERSPSSLVASWLPSI